MTTWAKTSPEFKDAMGTGVKFRRVWKVTPQAIPVPEWIRKFAVRGLQRFEDSVWLKRLDAEFLALLDRESGGTPLITETIYMFCPVCRRPLLGEDAELRIKTSGCTGTFGSKLPCGPECYPAVKDRRWRKRS